MTLRRHRLLAIGTLCITALLASCSHISYYWQAAQGQWALQNAAEPVTAWLQKPALQASAQLKEKLRLSQAIRAFASDALALPRNQSYTQYADLKRPAAVWNVFATPELSLKLVQSCFPIAGCVQYKGFFAKSAAINYAHGLAKQGLDVQITPVPAYSTLGWFDDPLLNTFIHYPEQALAKLIFHELAHQLLYVPGDTTFNESFATAVEEIGLMRWQAAHPNPAAERALADWDARRKQFKSLLIRAETQLKAAYELPLPKEQRLAKAAALAEIRASYDELKVSWGGFAGYDAWFSPHQTANGLAVGGLGNAHFAALKSYAQWVPAFHRMAAKSANLADFYEQVRALAKLPQAQRDATLTALLPE